MSIPAKKDGWFSQRMCGCISLVFSLTETLIVYGVIASVYISKQPVSPLMRSVAEYSFLFGGLGSLSFSITGRATDSLRRTASIALFISIAVFVFCGFPLLVST
jgi:hypothetical protein